MSKKIVKLTESDLVRIVKRVLREQGEVSPSNKCEEFKSSMAKYICPNCVEIEKFPLPDRTYNGNHSGNLVRFEDKYAVLIEFGVRGQFGQPVEIKDGKPVNLKGVCGYYEEKDN